MKRSPGVLLAVTLMAAPACGAIFNDGTTTNNLTQLANAVNFSPGYTTLVSDPGGFLVAGQVDYAVPALRTAWYANTVAVTSAVYTVSADFKPALESSERRGGVAAWLDTGGSNYITCQVAPGLYFRVSVVNFLTGDAAENESTAHLFNLDGTPATDSTDSARAELGTSYVATDFATFELQFLAPTPAELSVLSNATAHVAARVWQPTGTNRVQVSRTIELLTDLPLPEPAAHRFGYFGLWGSLFEGSTIGYFRNLGAEGALHVNQPPSVRITSPAPDATFFAPATVTLVAEASDPDGTVAHVDFYADATWIGAATNTPFSVTWVDIPLGKYSLVAVATDNEGASAATPAPVTIHVISLPSVALISPTNGAVYVAPADIPLEADASDPNSTITHVDFYAGTNLLGSVTNAPYTWTWSGARADTYQLTAVAFNGLGGQATSDPVNITVNPSGVAPTLLYVIDGGQLLLTWTVPGYQLQMSTNIASSSAWSNVPDDTSSLTEYRVSLTSAQPLFYRLVWASTPGRPSLTIQWVANQVLVSWPASVTGFRLEARDDLNTASWTPIATTGNSYSESAATGSRFFRLTQ